MKHYGELIEFEGKLIDLKTFIDLLKAVTYAAPSMNKEDLESALYGLLDVFELNHKSLSEHFQSLFEAIRNEEQV